MEDNLMNAFLCMDNLNTLCKGSQALELENI